MMIGRVKFNGAAIFWQPRCPYPKIILILSEPSWPNSCMDLHNKSSLSRPQHSQPKSPLRSTLMSSHFRTTARTSHPAWGCRVLKDTHDLHYDVDYSQIKGKYELGFLPQARTHRKRNTGGESERRNKRQSIRVELMSTLKHDDPEKILVVEPQMYSTMDTQGLCKYEFEKTIAGRLRSHDPIHLDFRNQVPRDKQRPGQGTGQSLHQAKHPRHCSSPASHAKQSPAARRDNRCHDFGSYSPRRIFDQVPLVDKFYATEQCFRISRPKRIKSTARLSGVPGRQQSRPQESQLLAYDDRRGREVLLGGSPSHAMGRSPRVMQMGREVINSARGCCR